MNPDNSPTINEEYCQLPADAAPRHEALVDLFGRFLFWVRNRSIAAARTLVESEDARQRLGSIRRKCYADVAAMAPEQRAAALALAEETVNGFGERLVWFLGGRGTDLKFGSTHAYRFQIVAEIVEVKTNEVLETETVSIGGKKFFGKYWGRWLNKYPLGASTSGSPQADEPDPPAGFDTLQR